MGKRSFIEWAARPENAVMSQLASLVAPRFFLNAMLAAQRGWPPRCTLSFDCDFPRDVEVLPRVVALLRKHRITASFACIGRWIQQYPAEHQQLVSAGHEILNHTYSHPNLYHPDYDYARSDDLSRERFNDFSPAQRMDEIVRCHEICADVLDYEPVGFRTPHFGVLHVDDVYPMLGDIGYRYSSSKLAAASPSLGLPYITHPGVWEFPVSPCPRHPFGVFDSWHSIGKHRPAHAGAGVLSSLFIGLAERICEQGGYLNAYLDPKDALESGELAHMLEYLAGNSLEVCDYRSLVELLDGKDAGVP